MGLLVQSDKSDIAYQRDFQHSEKRGGVPSIDLRPVRACCCWVPWHACSGAPASREQHPRGRRAQWWGWLLPSGWTSKTLTCPTPAASTCCPSSQQRSRRTTSTPGRRMTRESFRTTWRCHMTSPSVLRTTTPSVLPMAAGTTGARAARVRKLGVRKFELGSLGRQSWAFDPKGPYTLAQLAFSTGFDQKTAFEKCLHKGCFCWRAVLLSFCRDT